MSPEIERELWDRTKKQPDLVGEWPRAIIADFIERGLIKSPKQAWATLEKWCWVDLYDYGVNLELGWIRDHLSMPENLRKVKP